MNLSVLHILPSLELGGAERVTIALAQFQREQNLDAQILSLRSYQDFLSSEAESAGIPLHVSPEGKARFSRYRYILGLCRKFDVLHIHSPRGLRFIAPLIGLLSSKTIVYTRHGLDPLDSPKWKLVHAATLPFIDHITFVTQFAFDVFAKRYGGRKARMRVITNGVELPSSVKRSPSDKLRFGSVGRMVALKGQSVLLDAVALLEKAYGETAPRRFVLKFYGAGPVEGDLKKQSESIAEPLVEFCGEVSDIESIYENIDVLVVASRSEGLSMVIIEGMARNLPTIATEVGGNPTLVIPEETGILIPYGNKEGLAAAMKKLIEEKELVLKYGMAARELVQQQFSITHMHESYLDCYQSKAHL